MLIISDLVRDPYYFKLSTKKAKIIFLYAIFQVSHVYNQIHARDLEEQYYINVPISFDGIQGPF